MSIKFYIKTGLLLVSLFVWQQKVFSQYTGGYGSGFDFGTSAPQTISSIIYNDLNLISITNLVDGDSIPAYTSLILNFDLQNNGPYPVLKTHGLHLIVWLDNYNLLQYTHYLSDSLGVGQTTNLTITDTLFINTPGDFDLCVEINGTTFAPDSLQDNNSACVSIFVYDATNVKDIPTDNGISLYFDYDAKCLHTNGIKNHALINIYDIHGRLIKSSGVEYPKNQFCLRNFESGFYVVQLIGPKKRHQLKFFIP